MAHRLEKEMAKFLNNLRWRIKRSVNFCVFPLFCVVMHKINLPAMKTGDELIWSSSTLWQNYISTKYFANN